MKTCPCGTTGPENFYSNVSRPGGLSFYCKTCTAKRSREYHAKKPKRDRSKALKGNKNALKHGRYSGEYVKRKKVPTSYPLKTGTLDMLIRMPFNRSLENENPESR